MISFLTYDNSKTEIISLELLYYIYMYSIEFQYKVALYFCNFIAAKQFISLFHAALQKAIFSI